VKRIFKGEKWEHRIEKLCMDGVVYTRSGKAIDTKAAAIRNKIA